MSTTDYGPEPLYYVDESFSGVGFDFPGTTDARRHEVAPKYVDPDVRRQGAAWLALRSDNPATVVRHENGNTPEQVAYDMLLATFSALNGVQAEGDLDQRLLARTQEALADMSRYLFANRGVIA